MPALDIPARYFTGYASHLSPPDFHACFEAYLSNIDFFDATKLSQSAGLVKIATARDASEIPVASYYGDAACTFMDVQCFHGFLLILHFHTLNWTRKPLVMIDI